ncbi:hypothetical protein AAFF_G00150670 [Aldrovandia affinis]|uniref:Uncharacterized protein n=1 Tax=Aldrovandia affinis TaxID=143900 RepID=A0AAD7RP07_9TELE|nr:hypothetical protein AAFF_G00150670 [Aldrovandia affinis]
MLFWVSSGCREAFVFQGTSGNRVGTVYGVGLDLALGPCFGCERGGLCRDAIGVVAEQMPAPGPGRCRETGHRSADGGERDASRLVARKQRSRGPREQEPSGE